MIETDITYLETHLNIALSLYMQRANCIEQKYVQTSIQHAIEKRLLVHLHILTHTINKNEKKPKDNADLFVYISRRILSSIKEHQQEVLLFSKQMFIEHPYPKGLIDAFILFYNEDINRFLNELYEENRELRATIITIWHYCGQRIPIGLLNQSELQHQDNGLQSAVLNYHAEQDNISLELFQNYYRSLIEDVHKENLDSSVIHASLWGGMLRQDRKVATAIRRAIELESDEMKREKYLRLAALNGSNEFLPIFNSVSENKPEFGSYLISLLGTTESIKILFTMLQKPRISLLIIPAWQLITGQELKVVPRISLVESNPKAKPNVDKEDDVPLIADIKSAQIWAKKHVPKWKENSRYIHGEICSKNNLIELSYLLSGKIGKDVFDLLSLNFNRNLNLKLNMWMSDKFKILDEISKN